MKRRIYQSLLYMCLLPVVAVGCSSDITIPGSSPVDEGQLRPVFIEESFIETGVPTRAATGVSGGSMGVFLASTNNYTAKYNVQYTYSASATPKWGATTPIYVGGENAVLSAYYPYGSVTFNAGSTVATLDAQAYSDTKDMCYTHTGGAAVCNKTPQVTFNMVRAYSRLLFSITRSTTQPYPNACKVTQVKMAPDGSGKEFYTKRTLDISKAAGTAGQLGGTKAADWTLNTSSLAMGSGIAAGATQQIDMLFPPQTFTANTDTKITLTIDNKPYIATIPYVSFKEMGAGKYNEVKLEIQGTALVLGSVTTTDWVTGSHDLGSKFD